MPAVVGRCANPSCKAPDGRVLRYLSGTVCSYGACQRYASAQITERQMANAADDATESAEQCFVVDRVLGVRECEPKQLTLPKRRAAELQEEDVDICYEIRGQFGVDEADALRAGFDTRWVRLADLLDTIEYESLDEALSAYEHSVQPRMKRARVDAHNALCLEAPAC